MRKSKLTESQVVGILKEAEAGVPVAELLRRHGISRTTFFKWRSKYAGASVADVSFSNRPCTTWGGRGTSARTDAGGPMRAYSMDLRERALLDSDAGMKAADVAAKYRVSGSWVRLLKQRRRETGDVAPRGHCQVEVQSIRVMG